MTTTPQPNDAKYDREVIACMLENMFNGDNAYYTKESVDTQISLLREADNLDASGVHTAQLGGGVDEKILWGVVANAGRLSSERKPRWSHVMEATGQGSTSATELCRRFGFDPEEARGGDPALWKGGA